MTNWMISSGVLTLIVIGMRYLLKGKISARLQYALWLLVAVRLLVPISFGNSVLSVENITNQILPMQEDSVVQDIAQENMIVESVEEIHAYQEFVANEGVPGTDVNDETTYVPTENNTSETNILFGVWLIGVVGTAGVFLITNSIFQRKAKKGRNALYVNWCKIPVYVSDEVETPCLAGVFSPVIYVTKEVAEEGRLLRHTVTHEMMHYKQGDCLWALIRCACLVLHWYNPLVWWAAILSKKDAEFSCDEATIKALGEEERKDYGKTLIQLSSKEKYNLFLTATAMTAGKKSIKERIILIAKKPKAKWYTLVACVLISCVAVGCTFTQGEKQNDNSNTETINPNEGMQVFEDVNIDTDELHKELERVVGSIGLENAYPWNNTVELKENANALIKMASDETGRFEIYGIMSEKYGTYGLLLADWIDGEQNRNFAYVPWCYSRTSSTEPKLKMDSNGQYIFSYVYEYDEEPLWQEYVLDCGYDTGHMELQAKSPEPDYWMKPDERKVCLAVMPDGVSKAGGDYRYIIPEDQTKWMDGYKQMRSVASGDGKWKSDERSMGVWVVFGEEWTCITDQGFIYDFEKRIEKSEAEDFYNLCMEEAYKNGIEPIRPEDIGDLASVSIEAEGYGTITITDDYILDEIQKTFNLSTELRGGAACPFTTSLILKSEDGKNMYMVYLASDTCSTWLSDGVYYEDSYGITEGLKDMLNAQKMVADFSRAYFANDVEALKSYMLPTSSVEVTGYTEGETIPIINKMDGLEGCVHNYKSRVSVEIRVSEDADYFVYLEICIRKHEGEWKVESYWLEQ